MWQAARVEIMADAGVATLLAWLCLLVGHGGFWRTNQRLPHPYGDGQGAGRHELAVVRGEEPPEGWAGKVAAMARGVDVA